MQDKQQTSGSEDNDRNRQPEHDPVQAGKEAIEASKLNETNKPASQQREEESKDAEQWRNDG